MPLAVQHLPILDAARRGEPNAVSQLLALCKLDVRRYAMRHCLVNVIDDAVQETLLTLARKVHMLQNAAALSSWLFKIVQRQCRRLGRTLLHFDPYEESKVDSWLAQRPEEAARIDVVHAFDSLPAHYREIILLRDCAGYTIGEIAAHSGLSITATKSRLHRARELTREYLLA